MKTKDFKYSYPEELVAQTPPLERDGARMMHVVRNDDKCKHSHRMVRELPQLLNPGDLLVLNDTKVLPVRLFGERESGGKTELILLQEINPQTHTWRALAKRLKRIKVGSKIIFDHNISARVIEKNDDTLILTFDYSGSTSEMLNIIGKIPLPPYITRTAETTDSTRYQTVFAKHDGSSAAPTAGLHLTETILNECRSREIDIAYVTLHVGIDTFQPLRSENVSEHKMHGEYFHVPLETLEKIIATRKSGGRVIAVGTTTVRALESSANLEKNDGITEIFIYPGYEFKNVDGMLTNFHQPDTTLILLVSAFAGTEQIKQAYQEAIKERYRLFSYGDAMLLL